MTVVGFLPGKERRVAAARGSARKIFMLIVTPGFQTIFVGTSSKQ